MALAFLLAVGDATSQTPAQIQYTYDTAGNIVQVARVSKPDLTVSNLAIGAITPLMGGSYSIPVSFTVNNVGNVAATGAWTDRGYLSANAVFDDADEVLGGFTTRSASVSPGTSYSVSAIYTTATTTTAGTYTLFVKADGGAGAGQFAPTGANSVDEFSENNNVQGVSVTLPPKSPDLTVTAAGIGAISINQAGAYSFPVTYTVNNLGSAATASTFYGLAYLSSDATLDNADQNLGGYSIRSAALAAGSSYGVTQTYTTSTATTPGNYTLFVKADGRGSTVGGGTNTDNGNVAESNETNNAQNLALTLPAKPDLAISNVSVGTIVKNANNSYNVSVTFTVTNVGGINAPPNWYDLAYLSIDATLDNADQNLGGYSLRNVALAPGAGYTVTKTYTTSTSTAAGTYTLFVKTDGRGTAVGSGTNTDSGLLVEGVETNNVQALSVTLP